ncbi:MAG: hypothetical protein ACJAZV_002423, partial [Roseivirga sp.]
FVLRVFVILAFIYDEFRYHMKAKIDFSMSERFA